MKKDLPFHDSIYIRENSKELQAFNCFCKEKRHQICLRGF